MAIATHSPTRTPIRVVGQDPLVVLDGHLRIISLSRAAETLFGRKSESAAGRPAVPLLDVRRDPEGSAFDARSPGMRLITSGWPAAPERVRATSVDGRTRPYLLTLAALDSEDGGRYILCHLHPLPEAEPTEDIGPGVGRLTERQLEVLTEIGRGRRCAEIALQLGVSETTIRHHIRAILGTLGVHSQIAAVAEARRRGIIA